MKFTKIAAAAIGTVMLSFIAAGCAENKEDAQKPEKNIPSASVNSDYQAITIDGNTVNMDDGTIYRGLGAVSANNSSRLLLDYKAENPDAYWEIMKLLFQPDYGAGLTHVKIEFGTDVNSSSGTEPSIMRAEDEPADVTRGAGFQFAADGEHSFLSIQMICRWHTDVIFADIIGHFIIFQRIINTVPYN